MAETVKRARAGRRRVLGVLTGLAISGAAMLAPVGGAQAAPGDGPATTKGFSASSGKGAAVPRSKVPAGAVRVSKVTEKSTGAQGKAFQEKSDGVVTPNVVGGTLANPADYPWIIGIHTYFYVDDGSGTGNFELWRLTCTGSVITSTRVLTAGHCAVGLTGSWTYVIAGRSNLDGADGYVARVNSVWIHENFNLAALNNQSASVPIDDVAVMTLKSALPSVYTPVGLTAQGDQTPYADGTGAKVVGYGVTTPDGSDSGILHEAPVTIRSDATCGGALGGYDAARMTCAGTPGSGVDSCHGDSGGPLLVNGVQVGITDWGQGECGDLYGVYERLSYYNNAIGNDATRPAVVNLDWSGDGHTDLLARDNSTGELIEVTGSGFLDDGYGGLAYPAGSIGNGWNIYTKLFRVTNWNGDGRPSIMGRNSAGQLFQYKNDGDGGFASGAIQVGTGWNMFNDVMVVNNWNGDGKPNLLGRTPSGDLYIYTSNLQGGWENGGIGIKIGNGWGIFDTILTPGTWNGDGLQALIGRTPSGDLYLYHSDGHGGWTNGGVGIKIGNGWNIFNQFFAVGDWSGDRRIDVVGITPAGQIKVYKTDGLGNWLNPLGQQIDTGWNGLYVF